MSRNEIEGSEFDWFAVDGAGHVGHFASAGFGPVPSDVLARLDELRDFDKCVLELPIIGSATGHLAGHIEGWLEMARRGLFAYDWQHWSGPYRRAATPSEPVQVAMLPERIRQSISIVKWPDVRFAVLMVLRPENLCRCE